MALKGGLESKLYTIENREYRLCNKSAHQRGVHNAISIVVSRSSLGETYAFWGSCFIPLYAFVLLRQKIIGESQQQQLTFVFIRFRSAICECIIISTFRKSGRRQPRSSSEIRIADGDDDDENNTWWKE